MVSGVPGMHRTLLHGQEQLPIFGVCQISDKAIGLPNRGRAVLKKDIHPPYYNTKIVCACGAELPTHSTSKSIRVEICSSCHPFFTGKQKLVDTAGRVEKYRRRYQQRKAAKPTKKA